MKKFFTICTLLLAAALFSATTAGTAAAAFLKIGVGAKPSALGDAYIGIADDQNAVLLNPGGLCFLEKGIVSFTHLNWIADTNINSLTAVYGLKGIGTFGLTWENLNYGVIQGTNELGEETEEFTPQDTLFTLAYGRQMGESLGVGLNLKYISSVIQDYSAGTVAFDIGLLYKTELAGKPVKAGLSVRNVGGKMTYDVEGDSLPMYFGIGASYVVLSTDTNNVMAALDIGKASDTDLRFNIGAQYSFKDFLAIRLGYKLGDYDVEGFSGGLGAGYTLSNGMRLALDYAYGSTSSEFSDVHRISFSFLF